MLHQWEKKEPILLDTKARRFGVPNLAFTDTPILNTLKNSSCGHFFFPTDSMLPKLLATATQVHVD